MTIINPVYKVNVYIHFHYSLLRHTGLFGQFLRTKKLIIAEDMCIFSADRTATYHITNEESNDIFNQT